MKTLFTKAFNDLVVAWGYDSSEHFINSTFHPDFAGQASAISGTLAMVAYYFDKSFGFQLPVGFAILVLFFLEMRTGILASKKDGEGWNSDKFQKGWLKFGVYWVVIGILNILDVYARCPEAFGFELDLWAFVHFSWYNYVIIQLLGSNIENFIRLGWDKNSMLVRILQKIYNIKIKENGGGD